MKRREFISLFGYWAWMTRDQTVQFRNDVYAQDEQLLEATAEEAAFFNQAANHPLTAYLAQ